MRGETRHIKIVAVFPVISIHSPHARGDTRYVLKGGRGSLFQSTPLMRGETGLPYRFMFAIDISIHSPHARGDSINL